MASISILGAVAAAYADLTASRFASGVSGSFSDLPRPPGGRLASPCPLCYTHR